MREWIDLVKATLIENRWEKAYAAEIIGSLREIIEPLSLDLQIVGGVETRGYSYHDLDILVSGPIISLKKAEAPVATLMKDLGYKPYGKTRLTNGGVIHHWGGHIDLPIDIIFGNYDPVCDIED